jgi:hypothetical protein
VLSYLSGQEGFVRLLSLLLGVGLVLGLTVYVMDRVNQQEQRTAKDVGVRLLPGGIVVPQGDSPAVASGGALDAAQTVACATTAQALRTAEDSYQVLNGHYADLPTLVQSGTLRAPSEELYRIESTDGFTTYHLVGEHGCP